MITKPTTGIESYCSAKGLPVACRYLPRARLPVGQARLCHIRELGFRLGSRKKIRTFLLLVFLLLLPHSAVAQGIVGEERGDLRIMFYNVENLFDTVDDTLVQDDEFLPGGERYWTPGRYRNKLNRLYKVIVALGGWKPPEIIGLCEVENRKVLEDLLQETPLSRYNYSIIHRDSPDKRGIDVALLYLEDYLTIIHTRNLPVTFASEPDWKTRDILSVKALTSSEDTIYLFVNHWPSRSGGQLETEGYRLAAASVLREEIDRIFTLNPEANVIAMGDFNDNPDDRSIRDLLSVDRELGFIVNERLYNLSQHREDQKVAGSYKYQMGWDLMDQFIVSARLLSEHSDLQVKRNGFRIFSPDFLLEEDDLYMGVKPFRTYFGFRYQNGFSDHLPVYIDLWKREENK